MSFVYLASPYTDPSPDVREARYDSAARISGQLMEMGFHVFSPVVHGHACERHMQKALPWEWWMSWSRTFLLESDELWIVCIHGWDTSKGVRAEWELAKQINLPVRHVRFVVDGGLLICDGPPVDLSTNWGGVE